MVDQHERPVCKADEQNRREVTGVHGGIDDVLHDEHVKRASGNIPQRVQQVQHDVARAHRPDERHRIFKPLPIGGKPFVLVG